MLSFAGSLKIFVALEACDMRKRVQWALRPGNGAFGGRSQARLPVCLHQSTPQPVEDFILGRNRVVVMHQTTGARDLFLAEGHWPATDQALPDTASAGDVDRWRGPARGKVAPVV